MAKKAEIARNAMAPRRVRVFVVLALMVPGILAATTAARGETSVLTLRDFIANATAYNPEIFGELKKLKESRAQEAQARAVYDIVFNIHYSRLYDKPYTQYSTVKIHEQTTDTIGGGVQWIVPYSGARLRTGVEYSKNRFSMESYPPSSPFAPLGGNVTVYTPEAYIELQQPLLRNWLGVIDRSPVQQAELNNLITRETVNESIETISADLYTMYFEWYLAYRLSRIMSASVTNSESLLATVTAKHAAGLSEKSDISKARIMNVEYRKSRELYDARYRNATGRIRAWNGGTNAPAERADIIPQDELPVPFEIPPGFSILSTRRMKLLHLTKKLLVAQLEKEKSQSLPDLTLNFQYRLRDYKESRGVSATDYNYNNYTAGVSFSRPLGNCLASGKIDELRAQLEKWDTDVKDFERSYARNFEDVKTLVGTYESLVAYNRELLVHAEAQVREEEKKYRAGRSDLYFVIQYRNARLNYELISAADYVDYQKLKVRLLDIMDEIIR